MYFMNILSFYPTSCAIIWTRFGNNCKITGVIKSNVHLRSMNSGLKSCNCITLHKYICVYLFIFGYLTTPSAIFASRNGTSIQWRCVRSQIHAGQEQVGRRSVYEMWLSTVSTLKRTTLRTKNKLNQYYVCAFRNKTIHSLQIITV